MTPLYALLRYTKGNIYVCSLLNDSAGEEKRVVGRDIAAIKKFMKQWDVAMRGMFFCVSTIRGSKRNLESAYESPFLHVDIDFKNFDMSPEEITDAVLDCDIPPTMHVTSGNGLHAYWVLERPVGPDRADEVTDALKKLQTIFGGDKAVSHRAALMRLPGTHNTKRGEWKEVKCHQLDGKIIYFSRLKSWLDKTPAILRQKSDEPKVSNDPLDYFAAYAAEHKPPIDVPARLAAMEYEGDGDGSIHLTQLSCIASLANSGMNEDDVTEMVLEQTTLAAHGLGWNMAKEERKIRKMYRTWVAKKGDM